MKLHSTAAFFACALASAIWAGRLSGGLIQDRVAPDSPNESIEKMAAREEAPLWRIPLGAAYVDDLRPLGPGRLLVGLKEHKLGLPNQDYLLVDLEAGEVVWRFERREKGDFEPILTLRDLLVFRGQANRNHSVIVADVGTGKERWKASLKGDEVALHPLPTFDRILVERRENGRVELSALGLADGRRAWRHEPRSVDPAVVPTPAVSTNGVWQFYAGTERIRLEDGATLWSRPDVVVQRTDPQPQLDEALLYIAHGQELLALDSEGGATRWSGSLEGYSAVTNIYPYDSTLYVRGIADPTGRQTSAGRGAFLLSAFRAADGQLLWRRRTVRPTVSNFVEADGRLYAATPTSLVALDVATGEEIFETEVENASRLYPVRIRAYPDKVVFIGEFIVAAYDPVSGARFYQHGITPISQLTSLAGLDASIPRLKAQLSQFSYEQPGSTGLSAATFPYLEAQRYQNLANHYHSQASSQRQMGDSWGASLSEIRGQTSSEASRTMSQIALGMSIIELFLEFRKIKELQAQRSSYVGWLEEQQLFRRSILSAYSAAESGDYVYRPHRQLRSGGSFATVALIHLPTGRRRNTVLSPTYMNYGLWNYVDLDRGVVYHHGIGLDPSAYEYSDKRDLPPSGKVRTVNTFLIAAPLRIPR